MIACGHLEIIGINAIRNGLIEDFQSLAKHMHEATCCGQRTHRPITSMERIFNRSQMALFERQRHTICHRSILSMEDLGDACRNRQSNNARFLRWATSDNPVVNNAYTVFGSHQHVAMTRSSPQMSRLSPTWKCIQVCYSWSKSVGVRCRLPEPPPGSLIDTRSPSLTEVSLCAQR